jgi:hypothetical protein
MGATDGHVSGTTKVVDHGPDSARWNLVIVGDGYRVGELPSYHTHVENFIGALRSTPPFDELFCGVNLHRVDVVSTDSGADDPACAGGTAVTAATYFDATFCSNFAGSPLDRLLTVDSTLALSVAGTQVPLRHQVVCIVNSTKYGGSGGAVATCSVHAQANQIAIHELGHSAFGLADEYGGDGAATPAGEPAQPNVTRDTNRATNKWRALIAATTPMPSQCDKGCASSTCVPPASPPPAGAVGTYEGAVYSDCNTYRPLPSCYMRDYGPFCPVCSGVIRTVLAPFQPVSLVTPSIVTFVNVAVGATATRTVRIKNTTGDPVTVQLPPAPPGVFEWAAVDTELPHGEEITVQIRFTPVDATIRTERVRITSTAPGSHVIALLGKGIGGIPQPEEQPLPTQLTFEPAVLNFGPVVVGGHRTLQLRIGNGTGRSVRVSIAPAAPGSIFQWAALDTSLATGTELQVSVTFRPVSNTIATGTLAVASTTASSPESVGLIGKGPGGFPASAEG